MTSKQFYYVMLGTIVVGFIGIFGAFYWGKNQIEGKAYVISELQTDRDIAREKIIVLEKAQRTAVNKEEAEKLLENLLPSTKKQETLVADVIYTASAEAGIPVSNITAINFSSSGEPTDISGTEAFKEMPGVLSYPFNMVIQEISYETLLKLLTEIENNGRLVQVDNVQITPSKNNPGDISSLTLSMKAFLMP